MAESPLVYLTIINIRNEPVLFKSFSERSPRDELNFHMHFYSALDLLEDNINKRKNEYLGCITSIYSTDGDYDIYGYYTACKVKMMVIVRQKSNPLEKYEDTAIIQFFKALYALYKSEVLNPFYDEKSVLFS